MLGDSEWRTEFEKELTFKVVPFVIDQNRCSYLNIEDEVSWYSK